MERGIRAPAQEAEILRLLFGQGRRRRTVRFLFKAFGKGLKGFHRDPSFRKAERVGLQLLLEAHSGERVKRAEFFGTHRHDDRAVCPLRVSGVMAHAVDGQAAVFRRRVDHIAARTHAETVNAPAGRHLRRQLVGCGRQVQAAHLPLIPDPVLPGVDQGLGMDDPESDSKAFLGERDALASQHPDRVSGAVPDRENDDVGVKFIRLFSAVLIGRFHPDARDMPAADQKVGHLRFKAHLSARSDQLLPEVHDRLPQAVRTDMRMVFIQDVFRSACRCKDAEDLRVPSRLVFDVGGQLAVGEGSGSALPELDVGRRIQFSCFPERPDVPDPLLHLPSALQKHRPVSVFGQHKRAEKAGRTASDYNRPVLHFHTVFRRTRKTVRRFPEHPDLRITKL